MDSNDENLVDITNNGTDITNEVNVFENTIQKKPNTMIYYKRTDKEDSTWQKLEETSFDNNMITLYKEIIASRTNGEFIKLGYDTYYNISYRDYTRDQLINIYNDALENGYETQYEALSRIFDSLEGINQNLIKGITIGRKRIVKDLTFFSQAIIKTSMEIFDFLPVVVLVVKIVH